MAFRKKMSRGGSKRLFRRTASSTKKINLKSAPVHRGGIRF